MDFGLMMKVAPFFVEAAIVTVQLSILSIALGLLMGALSAAGRLSDVLVFRMIAASYVSVFRGTPCLIQLFILYFGGPQVGINLDPFAAGAIGLGINIGAYMSETIRGAIVAVNRGQAEAARTLGLSKFQLFTKWYCPRPQD